MTPKSPFILIEQFISPLMCEDILDRLDHTYPNVDINNHPIKTVKANRLSEIRVLPFIQDLIPSLEEYYSFEYKGLLPFDFEWFVSDFKLQSAKAENSVLERGIWKRVNDYDFTGIIFLNDYRETAPFDDYYEVAGGKLEFIYHQFSIAPKRGTLVIFPSSAEFTNATSAVLHGELTQIRFQISATIPYTYNSKNFPGTFKDWFTL